MHEVPRDGDCLFYSVALHLQRMLHKQGSFEPELMDYIHSLGFNSGMNVDEMVVLLRRLLVDEWLTQRNRYISFFGTELDFEQEAITYERRGVFSTELGDSVVLGLSNVLHLPFIIFTSARHMPIVPVHPLNVISGNTPILLAFQHVGPGHYNPAIPDVNSELSHGHTADRKKVGSVPLIKPCRCGRGRNITDKLRLNCSNKSDYTSRCPCLKATMACTEMCQCLNCDNPFGQRVNITGAQSDIQKRRKRPRHPEQDQSRRAGIKFMKAMNEQPLCGRWTPSEHYLLQGVLNKIKTKDPDINADQHIGLIAKMFTSAITFIKDNHLSVSASVKTEVQVQAKLQYLAKEQDILKQCGCVSFLPSVMD